MAANDKNLALARKMAARSAAGEVSLFGRPVGMEVMQQQQQHDASEAGRPPRGSKSKFQPRSDAVSPEPEAVDLTSRFSGRGTRPGCVDGRGGGGGGKSDVARKGSWRGSRDFLAGFPANAFANAMEISASDADDAPNADDAHSDASAEVSALSSEDLTHLEREMERRTKELERMKKRAEKLKLALAKEEVTKRFAAMESDLAKKKEALLTKVARGEDVSCALQTIEGVMRAAEDKAAAASAALKSKTKKERLSCGSVGTGHVVDSGFPSSSSSSSSSLSSSATPTTVLENPSSWSARVQKAMSQDTIEDYFA